MVNHTRHMFGPTILNILSTTGRKCSCVKKVTLQMFGREVRMTFMVIYPLFVDMAVSIKVNSQVLIRLLF